MYGGRFVKLSGADYFVDWLTRLFEKIGVWAEEKENRRGRK